MEALRQPLEDGKVTISRVELPCPYPCSFMLVAAMNPCRCGYYGHPSRSCVSAPPGGPPVPVPISGPLLDRIDLRHVEVPPRWSTDGWQPASQGRSLCFHKGSR